jgi:hypothetical protein
MIVTVVLETIITYLVSAADQDSEETLLAVLLFIIAFAVSAVSQCGVLGDEGDMADSYCQCTVVNCQLSNHGAITSREQNSLFPLHDYHHHHSSLPS